MSWASTDYLSRLVSAHSWYPSIYSHLCPAQAFKEHADYEAVASTNPDFGNAVVRVNVFRGHRQVREPYPDCGRRPCTRRCSGGDWCVFRATLH
jgi:hypothetical protein